jgi:hypothetical protein
MDPHVRKARRDQVDAAVVQDVRCHCRSALASCAHLQSRQFPAHPRNAGTDQGLVPDEPEGEADQDRREGGEPRPLHRLPDGGSRHPERPLCRYPAPDRGTAVAA